MVAVSYGRGSGGGVGGSQVEVLWPERHQHLASVCPSVGHRNRAAVASSRSLPAAFIPRCLASPPAPCHNMRRVSNNSRSLSSPLSFFPPRLLFTCDRERERDLEMKVMVVKSTDSSLLPPFSFLLYVFFPPASSCCCLWLCFPV